MTWKVYDAKNPIPLQSDDDDDSNDSESTYDPDNEQNIWNNPGIIR